MSTTEFDRSYGEQIWNNIEEIETNIQFMQRLMSELLSDDINKINLYE